MYGGFSFGIRIAMLLGVRVWRDLITALKNTARQEDVIFKKKQRRGYLFHYFRFATFRFVSLFFNTFSLKENSTAAGRQAVSKKEN